MCCEDEDVAGSAMLKDALVSVFEMRVWILGGNATEAPHEVLPR